MLGLEGGVEGRQVRMFPLGVASLGRAVCACVCVEGSGVRCM